MKHINTRNLEFRRVDKNTVKTQKVSFNFDLEAENFLEINKGLREKVFQNIIT